MNHFTLFQRTGNILCSFRLLALLLIPDLAVAQTEPVTVTVTNLVGSASLPPRFLGLSYEMSMLLPQDGHYYFDANDQALVNTFKTLGIKSLRVGANAVDDPRIPVPQEKDIDVLFNFARAAGVKVIYSFRLKNGDPTESARLAAYIVAHDADALDCYAIGNEPNFYLKPYEAFFAEWKPHYDAILKAVPNAMFDGPSADGNYALRLAKDIFAGSHMAMASDHYYFLGSGRAGEKGPACDRPVFFPTSSKANMNATTPGLERCWLRKECLTGLMSLTVAITAGPKIRAIPTRPRYGRWIAPIGGRRIIFWA